ncbi:helix-turn-helix transcriptional regulator [Aquihabitans daechungensis]|uniref:helix-turn-helix domain-containing protein n=1 Tax=Aquihabitans daechungensis TaxID=1052257 RepID=UPI003BA1700B
MGASPFPQTLTPTERAVCDKVADGLTNRAIAEDLFVTIKAVEFHIHNSFLKLGVHNRTQLAIAYLSMRAPQDDVRAVD